MKKIIFLFFLINFLASCSQKTNEIETQIKGEDMEQQMIIAYNDGLKALDEGDMIFAAKKFNEAELLFPQSDWAPKASLMASYAYWSNGFHNQSIEELKRFLDVYPKSNNLDYAYYLMAINYYDNIVDEKKDLRPLEDAKKYFTKLINDFPKTDYAEDAKYKLNLINDIMAAKELYIARHYIKKQKWIAAINRLKFVIEEYETTIYTEEALHRMVEIHYILGLEDEAKKYASILGYNYGSGEWYKQTYRIFNKDYEVLNNKNSVDKKNNLLKRIKSFF